MSHSKNQLHLLEDNLIKSIDVGEHIKTNENPQDIVFFLIRQTIQDYWKSAKSNLKMPGKAYQLKKDPGNLDIELRRVSPNHTQYPQSVRKSLVCYMSYTITWHE